MLQDREKNILEAVIKEFIKFGKPVSSNEVCDHYDFGIKSATIRNELMRLEEKGFLYQPHVSGGRIPTDKGYEFFVSLVADDIANHLTESISEIFGILKKEFQISNTRNIVNSVSEELDCLGVGKSSSEKEIHKVGLDNLFESLIGSQMIENEMELFKVVRDFEAMDENMDELWNFMKASNDPVIFVGRSPITKSHHLSVIADKFENNGKETLLAAVGPKWMDYGKSIKFFKKLKSVI